ncbi:unnamed protein product [Cylindrotheca closterium]|uniref:HTH myb-type domain-containing protein n=1 Tax=Cylindrotheca closterium TaxID=2856 RepID=A0AAD2JPH4_9STRA|nr:unnamed protein product [Cylindrotheca closterium]
MHIPNPETPMEDKLEHIKKEVIPQEIMSPPLAPQIEDGNDSVSTKPRSPKSSSIGPVQRTGRWTPDEKILFLYGLKRFGKGRWKKMSIYLPHRSLVQIKSHAQKVLKRLEAGENVFRRLEENYGIVDSLIVQAAKQRDSLALPSDPKSLSAAKRKRQTNKEERIDPNYPTQQLPPNPENPSEGRGAVIAAAALCQLSSFGNANWEQQQQQQQQQQA